MEDALRRLGEDDIVSNSYIRLNVALAKDEQIPTDVLEKARRLAEERGFRFCLINPIRDAGSEDEKESHNRDLTMDQIREMSDEDRASVHGGLLHELNEIASALDLITFPDAGQKALIENIVFEQMKRTADAVCHVTSEENKKR